jgi:DNA-directed RNA polymerase subunit M/transcription elongation factor TFIIS
MAGSSRKKNAKKSHPGGNPANRGRRGTFPPVDSATFNRMARSSCSECGSANITWMTLGALAAQEGSAEQRDRARELLPLVGTSADAWTCQDCEGFGAFEQGLHTEGLLTDAEAELDAVDVYATDPMLRNRSSRTTCPSCGSGRLWWAELGPLADSDEAHSEWARTKVRKLGRDADTWACEGCGEVGAMGRGKYEGH